MIKGQPKFQLKKLRLKQSELSTQMVEGRDSLTSEQYLRISRKLLKINHRISVLEQQLEEEAN